jgi:hypothetical protein
MIRQPCIYTYVFGVQSRIETMSDIKIGNKNLIFDLILGTGPSTENKFKYPYSLAVDKQGRIYVADRGHRRIQVFNRDGSYFTSIGRSGPNRLKLTFPKALAVDGNNRLYVGDMALNNGWLYVLNEDFKLDKRLKSPCLIAQIGIVDDKFVLATKARNTDANVFILDSQGQLVSSLDPVMGSILASSRVNAVVGPSGFIILASEFSSRVRVRKFAIKGEMLLDFSYPLSIKNYKEHQISVLGDEGVQIPLCYDVAVDGEGAIYLLVSNDYSVNESCSLMKFNSEGALADSVEIPFLCSRLFIDRFGNFYFLSIMETGFLYRYRPIKEAEIFGRHK